MIVATAGHIDHGKTLLVKSLSGVDTDRLPEEKKLQMSIDLGFAYKKLNNGMTMGFVDVPGHERFIRNMITGVTGVDFALLVIAADDGPMPQTFEHLTIIDLLNISRGAVAITKIDKVGEERLLEVKKIISNILKETSLSKSPIFPISNLNKKGIKSLHTYLNDQTIKIGKRNDSGNFRLAIDRSFILKGTGLVVTGTALSGKVSIGDKVLLSSKGIDIRVRSIHSQGQDTNKGLAGQRCALNIIGPKLDLSSINRGDWILSRNLGSSSYRLDAKIYIAKTERKALKNWFSAHLHLGASNIACKIIFLNNEKMSPGTYGFVQLKLDQSTPSVFGDRFILRDRSGQRTIAGGIIIDPYPPQKLINRPERIRAIEIMSKNSNKEVFLLLLKLSSWGLDLSQFIKSRNITETEALSLFKPLSFKKLSNNKSVWAISKINWENCTKRVLEDIMNFHQESPKLFGIDKNLVLKKFKYQAPDFVIEKIIQELINTNKIQQVGNNLKYQKHINLLNSKDIVLLERVELILIESRFQIPSINKLAKDLNIQIEKLEFFLHKANQMGKLFKINKKFYLHPKTLKLLLDAAKNLAEENSEGSIIPGRFRDFLGIGRNLSIEILECFDKIGYTQRFKSGRIIKKTSEEIIKGYSYS